MILDNTKGIEKRDCRTVYNFIKTQPIFFTLTKGKL